MNKSNISVPSAGTEVDSDSTAQNPSVSQPNANTNVSSSYDEDYDEDYDDWEDDDYDPLESLAENCTCGAYIFGKDGRYRHVADCCC